MPRGLAPGRPGPERVRLPAEVSTVELRPPAGISVAPTPAPDLPCHRHCGFCPHSQSGNYRGTEPERWPPSALLPGGGCSPVAAPAWPETLGSSPAAKKGEGQQEVEGGRVARSFVGLCQGGGKGIRAPGGAGPGPCRDSGQYLFTGHWPVPALRPPDTPCPRNPQCRARDPCPSTLGSPQPCPGRGPAASSVSCRARRENGVSCSVVALACLAHGAPRLVFFLPFFLLFSFSGPGKWPHPSPFHFQSETVSWRAQPGPQRANPASSSRLLGCPASPRLAHLTFLGNQWSDPCALWT